MRDEIIFSPQRRYPLVSISTPKVCGVSGDICCNIVPFFLKRVNFDKRRCALLWNFTQPNNLTLEDGIVKLSWIVRNKVYSTLHQIPEESSSRLHRKQQNLTNGSGTQFSSVPRHGTVNISSTNHNVYLVFPKRTPRFWPHTEHERVLCACGSAVNENVPAEDVKNTPRWRTSK